MENLKEFKAKKKLSLSRKTSSLREGDRCLVEIREEPQVIRNSQGGDSDNTLTNSSLNLQDDSPFKQVFPKRKLPVKASKPKMDADKRKKGLDSKTVMPSPSKRFKADISPSLKQVRITQFFQSPAKTEEKTLWDFRPDEEVIEIPDSPQDEIEARVEAPQVSSAIIEPRGKSFYKQLCSPRVSREDGTTKCQAKKTTCKRLFSDSKETDVPTLTGPEDSRVPHSNEVKCDKRGSSISKDGANKPNKPSNYKMKVSRKQTVECTQDSRVPQSSTVLEIREASSKCKGDANKVLPSRVEVEVSINLSEGSRVPQTQQILGGSKKLFPAGKETRDIGKLSVRNDLLAKQVPPDKHKSVVSNQLFSIKLEESEDSRVPEPNAESDYSVEHNLMSPSKSRVLSSPDSEDLASLPDSDDSLLENYLKSSPIKTPQEVESFNGNGKVVSRILSSPDPEDLASLPDSDDSLLENFLKSSPVKAPKLQDKQEVESVNGDGKDSLKSSPMKDPVKSPGAGGEGLQEVPGTPKKDVSTTKKELLTPKKGGSPSKSGDLTPKKGGSPYKNAGSPSKNVRSPSKNTGSPSKRSGSPRKSGLSLIPYLISSPGSKQAWADCKVFSESDFKCAETFMELPWTEQILYTKLFARQHAWIRVNSIQKYEFVPDKDSSLQLLEHKGFLTSDVGSEDLESLLNLVQVPELKLICKRVKVTSAKAGKSSGNKKEMISSLLKLCSSQPSVAQSKFFVTLKPRAGLSSVETNVRQEALNGLPTMVKLTDGPRHLFRKLLLTTTYAHFLGDEGMRLQDMELKLAKLYQTTYPPFKHGTQTVFHSMKHFEEYMNALEMKKKLMDATEQKNWELKMGLVLDSEEKLRSLLKCKENMEVLDKLPDYLRRFTPGQVYAKLLSSHMCILKRFKSVEGRAVDILQLLLGQKYFCLSLRGVWCEELAKFHETKSKDLNKVAGVLLNGLRDKHSTPIQLRMLSDRATRLLKKKNSKISDEDRALLIASTVRTCFKAKEYTMLAQKHPGEGSRQVYTREVQDGKEYLTVEDIAKLHYAERSGDSYKSGLHDEGELLTNLVVATFWDEVYMEIAEENGGSLFHSPFQTSPLDWTSPAFFRRRQNAIQEKLKFIKETGVEAIMDILSSVCHANESVVSVVNWSRLSVNDLPSVEGFLRCLGAVPFALLAEHMLGNFRMYRSGLPDLTLWNTDTGKCLLVEVKSTNDTLSVNQTYWLEKLHQFGIPAEVCRVETTSTIASKKRTVGEGSTSQ